MAQLIDHEGKLAINFGWMANWDKPQEERLMYVARGVPSKHYTSMLGHYVEFLGNTGSCWFQGKRYIFQTDDKSAWDQVIEVRPVKKPRDGKYYTHAWHSGRWEKRSK